MGLSSLAGLVIGIGFVLYSIFSGGSIKDFWDISSVYIVVGGTFGAMLVNYPGKEFLNSFKAIKKVVTYKKIDMNQTLKKILELAYVSKKNGLLALEPLCEDIQEDFFKKGVMLIVDGTSSDMTRSILELEIDLCVDRDAREQAFMLMVSKFAPAFGMIGTLIGLIKMLKNLQDVSTVGPSMAVALVTTFYGAFIANTIFIPLAGRLKYISGLDVIAKEMMIEGIISIQLGETPFMIEEKLKKYIEEAEKGKTDEETAK